MTFARVDQFRTLFRYNTWANARVLAAAERLPKAALHEPAGLSNGSIFGALAHAFGAERVWRLRCQEGVFLNALPDPADYPSLADLGRAWAAEERGFRAFIDGLDDAALEGDLHYRSLNGTPQSTPLWQVLMHVVNHGTQFRGEAAVGLSQRGASPGDLDFIAFARAEQATRQG